MVVKLPAAPAPPGAPPEPCENFAELLERLGGIEPRRIRLTPAPGLATEADVLRLHDQENRLFELIDGVLVEKDMAFRASLLAGAVLAMLRAWVMPRKLGLVLGADGMLRLFPGRVRIPDACFLSWAMLPGGKVPKERLPTLGATLAVEVLSPGNTKKEIELKRQEYFRAGALLMWVIDPVRRTAEAWTAVDECQRHGANGVLDGAPALPGFTLSLAELFAELDLSAD